MCIPWHSLLYFDVCDRMISLDIRKMTKRLGVSERIDLGIFCLIALTFFTHVWFEYFG